MKFKHMYVIALVPAIMAASAQSAVSIAAEIEKDQIPATIEISQIGNKHERLHALNALAGVGALAESALPNLSETLAKDSDREVRRSAAFAIGGIVSGRRGITSMELHEGEKAGKYDPNRTYAPASDAAIDSLIQAAQQDNFIGVRVSAIMSLINIHPPMKRVSSGLAAILSREKDEMVLQLAVEALGYYPLIPAEAEPALRRIATESLTSNVRVAALNALKRIDKPSEATLNAIAAATSDSNLNSRVSIVTGAVKSIEKLSDNEAAGMASSFLQEMKDWGQDSGRKEIVASLLKSKHSAVRNEALRAIAETLWDDSYIPTVRTVLSRDSEPGNRVMATHLLRFHKVLSAKPELKRAAQNDADETVRAAAAYTVREFENPEGAGGGAP